MVVTSTDPSLPYSAAMGKPASSGDNSLKGSKRISRLTSEGTIRLGPETQWRNCGTGYEHKVLLEHFRRSHTPKYDDARSILLNVTLDQLLDVINHGVPANNWPTTKFSNKDCTKGAVI